MEKSIFADESKMGRGIATTIFGTDHLKVQSEYNRLVKEIQGLKDPIARLHAYLDSANQLLRGKNQYWLLLGQIYNSILNEKVKLGDLIKNKTISTSQLVGIGLSPKEEVENWELLLKKNERGEGFNKEWFCKTKLGMSKSGINQIIYVYKNYKKFGLSEIDVSSIGVTKVFELLQSKSDETNFYIKDIEKIKTISRDEIRGQSKARRVFGSLKRFSKSDIKEFIKLLRDDGRFNDYFKK